MAHPEQTRKFLRILWYAAIVVVVIASLLPSNSPAMRALGRLHISDKIEHFIAYTVLSFLPTIHERKRFILGAAIGAAVLGVLLEYGQLWSGWRDFEYGDMLADSVGVCFGVAAGIPLRATEVARSVLFGE